MTNGPTPPGPTPDDPASGRPAWLLPAAGGLAVGVIVALVAVFALGGGDDDTDLATSSTPVTGSGPDTTTPDTTVAVETTVAPDTTQVPDTTSVPATTEPDDPFALRPATAGTVRLFDQEFPITSSCLTVPFRGVTGGYQVTTYVFSDDLGRANTVGSFIDEGGASGVFFGDQYERVDFPDAGFGFFFFEGDVEVPAAVNPQGPPDETCAGEIVESATSGEQTRVLGIADVCFGDTFGDGSIGYRLLLSEGATLELRPNADSSFNATYFAAIDDFFVGVDENATSEALTDGRLDVSALVTETINGSDQRALAISIIEDAVATCP